MMVYRILLVVLLFIGCAQDRIERPEPFMTSQQMTNFLVDLALLNASTGYAKDHYVSIDSLYVYHGIDSLSFAKNNIYYVSKPKEYTRIFELVNEKLTAFEEIDTLNLEKPLLNKE